jgi:hypothetical protein
MPLFFVLFSLLSNKTSHEKSHSWIALIFFLLALGKYNPLYAAVVQALNLTAFRNPSKFLFFTVFSFCFLAGYGYDRWIIGQVSERARKGSVALFILILLLPFILISTVYFTGDYFLDWAKRMATSIYNSKTFSMKSLAEYHAVVEAMWVWAKKIASPTNPHNLFSIVLAIFSAGFFICSKKYPIKNNYKHLVVALLVMVDLCVFGRFFGAGFMGNAAPIHLGHHQKEAEKLKALTPGVIAEWTNHRDEEWMEPSANIFYSLPHAGAYSPLLIKRYYELAEDVGIVDSSLGRRHFSAEVWNRERRLLDLLGVDTIIADETLQIKDLKQVKSVEGRFIYINPNVLPAVFAVTAWTKIEDKDRRLDYIKSEAFDTGSAVIEMNLATNKIMTPSVIKPLVLERSDREMRATFALNTDAIAVARIPYFPRWKATINGEPTSIFAVNHAFSGVKLKAGRQELKFIYDARPHHFFERMALIAWIIALLGLALVANFFKKG